MEYKGQTAVEQRFRFLKDPSFVDAFFLHKPERIEALGYVMMLAALVFSIMERRIRHSSEPLVTPSRGELKNPTGREALQNMHYAMVIKVDAWHRQFSIPPLFRKPFRKIMSACGFDDKIYRELPTRRSG